MFQLIIFGLLVCSAFGAPQIRPKLSKYPRLDGKIVGGQATTIESYPYQASVQLLEDHYCGGSIISETNIISAAHCFERTLSWYDIRVGSSFHNSGGSIVGITRVSVHPNYNWQTLNNDIAIIFLSSSLTFSNAVAPIALPAENEQVAAGTDSVVTGWGRLTQGGSIPLQLQEVTVPIISNADCEAAYQNYDVTSNMLCAGYPEGGRDACQGDSGGPLAIGGVLFGIVSWGVGCAQPGNPGVYTSVPALRLYIRQVTGV